MAISSLAVILFFPTYTLVMLRVIGKRRCCRSRVPRLSLGAREQFSFLTEVFTCVLTGYDADDIIKHTKKEKGKMQRAAVSIITR